MKKFLEGALGLAIMIGGLVGCFWFLPQMAQAAVHPLDYVLQKMSLVWWLLKQWWFWVVAGVLGLWIVMEDSSRKRRQKLEEAIRQREWIMAQRARADDTSGPADAAGRDESRG